MNEYMLMSNAAAEAPTGARATLHDDAGVRTRAALSEERHWEFQSTTAFWAATFFLQGSALFTIGSIAMYPSILNICSEEAEESGEISNCQPEFMYKAWVDYSFMIGAWCFTAGNYAVYFQVINFEGEDLSFIAWPDLGDWGHLGALFNLFGAIAYNVNTMLFFDTADHDSIMYEYNLVYVISGGLGSILFALGALAEGEHNNWRDCNKETFKKPENQMAALNFSGAVLFLVAYIVEYNHYADHHRDVLVWVVCTPFTVGSIFFFIGSWMSLYMWKQQNFGLGYAKHINGRSHVVVDWKQQLMALVYIGCITMQWERLGICASYNWGYYHTVYILEITFRLLLYHCIMFLMSALHTTPDRHPFGVMLWSMRLIAIYAFFGDIYLLRLESIDPYLEH